MNEVFGWLWVTLGFSSGALIGLRFDQAEWWGGYNSFRRRLVRLGHISLIGLGILNILFAQSLLRLTLGPAALATASWALIIGGVTMPTACGLAAWKQRSVPLFAVPVVSLIVGGWLTVIGLVRS
jgi:hypothetical protein